MLGYDRWMFVLEWGRGNFWVTVGFEELSVGIFREIVNDELVTPGFNDDEVENILKYVDTM